MGKVVAGQMQLYGMIESSLDTKTLAADTMRTYINAVSQQQAFSPDVLPSAVTIHSTIESATGKLVSVDA